MQCSRPEHMVARWPEFPVTEIQQMEMSNFSLSFSLGTLHWEFPLKATAAICSATGLVPEPEAKYSDIEIM